MTQSTQTRFVEFKMPFRFCGWRKFDDVREWGFRLDLTTEITYYTYDWGFGWTFMFLGWGVEIINITDFKALEPNESQRSPRSLLTQ